MRRSGRGSGRASAWGVENLGGGEGEGRGEECQ